MDEAEFDAAWAEGAALSTEDAIAYAQRGRGERKRPASGWASLTPAEYEVVRLVCDGLANNDIAGQWQRTAFEGTRVDDLSGADGGVLDCRFLRQVPNALPTRAAATPEREGPSVSQVEARDVSRRRLAAYRRP